MYRRDNTRSCRNPAISVSGGRFLARKLWARKNSLPVLVHGITLAAFFLWALLPHYHVTSHRHAHGEDHGHHFPKEYYASEETGSWPVTDSHSPGEDFGTGHFHGEAFHQHDKQNTSNHKQETHAKNVSHPPPRRGDATGPWLTTGEALPHFHYWEDLNLSYLTSEAAEPPASLSEPPYREPRYTVPETRRWFVYSPRGPPLS